MCNWIRVFWRDRVLQSPRHDWGMKWQAADLVQQPFQFSLKLRHATVRQMHEGREFAIDQAGGQETRFVNLAIRRATGQTWARRLPLVNWLPSVNWARGVPKILGNLKSYWGQEFPNSCPIDRCLAGCPVPQLVPHCRRPTFARSVSAVTCSFCSVLPSARNQFANRAQ